MDKEDTGDEIKLCDLPDRSSDAIKEENNERKEKKKNTLRKRFLKSFRRLSCASGNAEDLKDKKKLDRRPLVKPSEDVNVEQNRSLDSKEQNLHREEFERNGSPRQDLRVQQQQIQQLQQQQPLQAAMTTSRQSNRNEGETHSNYSPNGSKKFNKQDYLISNGHKIEYGEQKPDQSDQYVNRNVYRETVSAQQYVSNPTQQHINAHADEQQYTRVNVHQYVNTPVDVPHFASTHVQTQQSGYNNVLNPGSRVQQVVQNRSPNNGNYRFHTPRRIQLNMPTYSANVTRNEPQTPDLKYEYDFSHTKRGKAVLIIMSKFKYQSERPLAKNDGERMKKIFLQLGFDVITIEDATAQDLRDRLKEIRDEIETKDSDCDTFACVISSHGDEAPLGQDPEMPHVKSREHVIYVHDGVIRLREILELFDDDAKLDNGKSFKALRGKPKLFFIQACRAVQGKSDEECIDPGVELDVVYGFGREMNELSSHADRPLQFGNEENEQNEETTDEKNETCSESCTVSHSYENTEAKDVDKSPELQSSEAMPVDNLNKDVNSYGTVLNTCNAISDQSENKAANNEHSDSELKSSKTTEVSEDSNKNIDSTTTKDESTSDQTESIQISEENMESHKDAGHQYDPITNRYYPIREIGDVRQTPNHIVNSNFISARNVNPSYSHVPQNRFPINSGQSNVQQNWSYAAPTQSPVAGTYTNFNSNQSRTQQEVSNINPPSNGYASNRWEYQGGGFSVEPPNIARLEQKRLTPKDLDLWAENTLKFIDDATSSPGSEPRYFVPQERQWTAGQMTAQSKPVPKEKVEFCEIPCGNDFVIMYASPTGNIAWSTGDYENPNIYDVSGWLPYCLHRVADSAWTNKSLLEVLTDANFMMMNILEANFKGGKYKAVGQIDHRLSKDIIFRPKKT